MKKENLIKQIASEFNVDEIKVLEYFDSIFETLAAAFVKNKNVNISEFGKFSVKSQKNEDGEKLKTVQFSPVKKFSDDINYNFSELLPVQIRLLDSTALAAGEDYEDYEAEEILLIDFEEEKLPVQQEITEEKTEILIHDEETETDIPIIEKPKEEILIPEPEKQQLPTLEAEKKKEEVLIPEIREREEFTDSIPEEIKEEKKQEPAAPEAEQERILGELNKIKFPEKTFTYIIEEVKPGVILSAAKKVLLDSTLYIKEEKIEEVIKREEKAESVTEEKREEQTIQEKAETNEQVTEEIKKEEESIQDEIEKLKAFITGDPENEIEDEQENIIPDSKPQDVFEDEVKEKEYEETVSDVQDTEQEETKEETQKTSLELEFELLQMLEERKKILEEINKLENTEDDDLVDISGPKSNGDDDKPRLHDESTLDRPRQNIFVDEEGKVLEDLLNLISDGDNKKTEIPEEDVNLENKEDITSEINNEIKEEEAEKKDDAPPPENGFGNLNELFGSIYEKSGEVSDSVEPVEPEPELTNSELKVFDRLLDDTDKPPVETPVNAETKESDDSEFTSFSDLEKMFRSFKTDIIEPESAQEEKNEEIKTEETGIKTETIKTYDDISNLIGPNGEKNEEKKEEKKEEKDFLIDESPKKRFSPAIRQIIVFASIIILILLFIFFYKKLVYQPSEPPKQLPVTAPVDSTKTDRSDSVIFADTNKTAEKEEAETVFEKDDIVIKETAKGFFIEFGEYENQFVLAKEIKILKDKGITPGYEEVKSEGKTFYKMKLGPYNSLKEAKGILSKL